MGTVPADNSAAAEGTVPADNSAEAAVPVPADNSAGVVGTVPADNSAEAAVPVPAAEGAVRYSVPELAYHQGGHVRALRTSFCRRCYSEDLRYENYSFRYLT